MYSVAERVIDANKAARDLKAKPLEARKVTLITPLPQEMKLCNYHPGEYHELPAKRSR